jgi:hypothetical protein
MQLQCCSANSHAAPVEAILPAALHVNRTAASIPVWERTGGVLPGQGRERGWGGGGEREARERAREEEMHQKTVARAVETARRLCSCARESHFCEPYQPEPLLFDCTFTI